MSRLELARRLGLRAVPLRCVNSGRSYVKLACRCGRHSRLGILRNGPTDVDHLLGLLGCPCLPPLRDVFTPAELRGFLQSLSFEELLDLRDAMQKKNPRQRSTDEGSAQQSTERESNESKDSAASGLGYQELGEGNELLCARHADCSGHDSPDGAA